MPIIGIITNNAMHEQIELLTLPVDYVKAILKSKGEPYLIPVIDDINYIRQIINKIDGLVIPGGKDIKVTDPKAEFSDDLDANLDVFEMKMIRLAREKQIPILGICRGHQILNFTYNGQVYQDISLHNHYDKSIIHNQYALNIPYHEPVHDIKIKQNSKLYSMFGKMTRVNSTHHQAVSQVGEGLMEIAHSPEHLIEAVEGKDDYYVLGVQWHPEQMDGEMQKIFDQFMEACNRKIEKSAYKIIPITPEYAKEIMNWKYDEPYALYNLENNEESLRELLENDYYVLLENNQLIGFYCVGTAAQVPVGHSHHMYDDLDFLDIGLGMNPMLCGKGNGYEFMEKGLEYFQKTYKIDKFRLTVFDFNKRAINLYHKCGFIINNYFKSNNYHYFLVMTLER